MTLYFALIVCLFLALKLTQHVIAIESIMTTSYFAKFFCLFLALKLTQHVIAIESMGWRMVHLTLYNTSVIKMFVFKKG